MTLTCSNRSDSRPVDYIPQTQYKWWMDNEPTSDVTKHLIIDPITRADHDVEYRCEGQEMDSAETGVDTLALDITCNTDLFIHFVVFYILCTTHS